MINFEFQGKYSLGQPIVPQTYTRIVMDKDGNPLISEFSTQGRNILISI